MKPVGSKTIRLTFCLGFLFALLLTIFACGGGDNNNSSSPPTVVEPVKVSGTPTEGGLRPIGAFTWAPDSSRIAYIAAQDSNSEELYSSTPDGASNNVKVSVRGTVDSFLWPPDLTVTNLIAYLADQQTTNVNELYTSTPEGQDNMNVSGSLESGGRVTVFYDWASATTGPNPLVFMAFKDSATTRELYVTSDNGQTTIKLSGPMVSGGNVTGFAISPNGRFVAYRADQETKGMFELYTVPIGGGTIINVSKLSGTILEVEDFAWAPNISPNRSQIAFRAFNAFTGSTGGNIELFTNFSSGGIPVTVSNSPSVGVDVDTFKWSPTGQFIAYTANTIVGSSRQFRLFAAQPDFENQAFSISNIPAATNQYTIGEFQWSPDGSILAFLADINILGVNELLVVEPITNSVPAAISGTLADGGEVVEFSWAPNNTRIAYLADQYEDEKFELITVFPDVNFLNPRPDPRLVSTNNIGDVVDFAWSPDSSRIGYIADGDTLGVFELFTNVAFGTSKFKVSGTLTQGGDVTSFAWAPDSSLIAYQASQDEANKEELYVTQPF
jgi:WD40-like Beta Propeller Repeat